MGPADRRIERSAWLGAACVFAALLVVPLLVWLIVPAPPPIVRPTFVAATERPETKPVKSAPSAEAPAPKPAATAAAVDAVRGRVVDASGNPVSNAFVGCTEKGKDIS